MTRLPAPPKCPTHGEMFELFYRVESTVRRLEREQGLDSPTEADETPTVPPLAGRLKHMVMDSKAQELVRRLGTEPGEGTPNLDGTLAEADLVEFAACCHDRKFRESFFELLFPNTDVVPVERIGVMMLLGDYAQLKAKAMRLRASGEVALAANVESKCETVYLSLPAYARW